MAKENTTRFETIITLFTYYMAYIFSRYLNKRTGAAAAANAIGLQ